MAARVAFRLHVIAIVLLVGMALDGRAFAAGELDPTFGTGGKAITSSALSGVDAKDMLIKSDGGIVVAGGVPAGNILRGIRVPSRGTRPTAAAVSPRPRPSARTTAAFARSFNRRTASSSQSGSHRTPAVTSDGIVARFGEISGTDIAFGTMGIVRTPLGSADGAFEDVLVDPDGNYVVVGSIDRGGFDHGVIARYLPDGTLDTSFASTGLIITGLTGIRFNARRAAAGRQARRRGIDRRRRRQGRSRHAHRRRRHARYELQRRRARDHAHLHAG